jgi:hypothetical protein
MSLQDLIDGSPFEIDGYKQCGEAKARAKRAAQDAWIKTINSDSRQQKRRRLFIAEIAAATGRNPQMLRSDRRKLARAYARKAWVTAA